MNDFDIDKGLPMPPVTTTRRPAKYPFAKLEIGDSFHVAQTDERKTPVRSMASIVSATNKRHTDKRFVCRRVDSTDPRGAGARVFRVDVL